METVWEQLVETWLEQSAPAVAIAEELEKINESFCSDQIHHLKIHKKIQLSLDIRKDGISHFLGVNEKNIFYQGLNPVPDRSTIYVHDFYELMYVLDGKFQIGVHDDIIVLQTGDICLMDTQCVHWDLNAGVDSVILYLAVAEATLESLTLDSPILSWLSETKWNNTLKEQRYLFLSAQKASSLSVWLNLLLQHLCQEQLLQEHGYETILSCLTERLLIRLGKQELEKKRVRFHPRKEQMLIQTEHYILEHLATVTASSLAKNLHYNTRYYNRLIQECYHITLTEYIQQKKLNEAKRLLLCTNLPIHEIITRVGYQNRSYFYRLFEKETKMTPQEYRQQRPAWLPKQ